MTHHSESTLLMRYLLPPSPLPTILPYGSFLSLLPSPLRTASTNPNSSTAIALKRLYQDLQFQRDIDVQTVAMNVERECARSVVLRGRVVEEVLEEMGLGSTSCRSGVARENRVVRDRAGEEGKRKRKRSDDDDDNDESEASNDLDDESETSETQRTAANIMPSKSIRTNSHPLIHDPNDINDINDARTTHLDTLFTGPRGLARPLDPSSHISPSTQPQGKYHDTTSLLTAMQLATTHLQHEINDLTKRNEELLKEMNAVVGDMSDLRYGKFTRASIEDIDGQTQEDGSGGGVEKEVSNALRQLRVVLGGKNGELGVNTAKATLRG